MGMPPISLDKAKPEKLFYFVATGVIYRDGKCLILQRSKKETAHPGLWGVIGGKLEHKDLRPEVMTRMNHNVPNWDGLVEELIRREAKEESGLDVSDCRYLSSVVFIRPDGVPVVCPKFACRAAPGKVTFPPEFDVYAWVDGTEVDKYDCILGIPDEVRKTIRTFSES